MKSIVLTEMMQRDGVEFLLADVSNSDGYIGLCDTSRNAKTALWETFYMDGEAIINIVQQSVNNNHSNKLIWQASSKEKCNEQFRAVLSTASDNYFLYDQSLTRSIIPVLEMLTNGLYVVHVSKMIPTDGAGNFFWNAYLVKHEFTGSATQSAAIPPEKNFNPCFLVPTENIATYADNKLRVQSEKIHNGKGVGGIAYHLTGMFCALIDGHHSATSALINGVDFNCIVIEPIRDMLFENADMAIKEGRAPKALALSSPFAKIPLGNVPKNMLDSFLLRRKSVRPENYHQIRNSSDKNIRYKNRRLVPKPAYDKAEQLPDCEMVESASVIDRLTDEQLDALLRGETMLNDAVIINTNYYSSIVTACNFLQFTDQKRFIEFAVNILYNPDLSAVHSYVAQRVLNVMNPRLSEVFHEISDSQDKAYDSVRPIALEYIKQYKIYTEQQLASKLKTTNDSFNMDTDFSVHDTMGNSDIAEAISKAKKEVDSKMFTLNS